MQKLFITLDILKLYEDFLFREEKSQNTIEKYIRDIKKFMCYVGNEEINKNTVISYKNKLINDNYSLRSVNSMIASLNTFFVFAERADLKAKAIKLQQQAYCSENKELTKAEYIRLVNTAEKRKNVRLSLMIQTICSMGIRVSELKFIIIEAVKRGEAIINLR